MGFDSASGREALRGALQPGKACPPPEQLESAKGLRHAESCAYCRTELELMRVFQTAPRDEEEAAAVRLIADRLRPVAAPVIPLPSPWWKQFLTARWLSPVAMAAACALIAVAVGLEWRHSRAPGLGGLNPATQEVLRSGSINGIAPAGDIAAAPKEIRWEGVTAAARYSVQLSEVDGHELWSTSTTAPRAEVPAAVQSLMVPAKTLLLRVTAIDAAGRNVAQSEPVRLRVLQNVYSR
jgi:hypothetical protein